MPQTKQEKLIQASIKRRVGNLSPKQVNLELTGLRKIIKVNKNSPVGERLTEHEKQTFLALKAKKSGNRIMRNKRFELIATN